MKGLNLMNADEGTRRMVALASVAAMGVSAMMGLVSGLPGQALFHTIVWPAAFFSYYIPGRPALVYGLFAAAFGFGLDFLEPMGQAAFLCQTAVLVLMGFVPSLFSEDEERRRVEREIVLQHERKHLEGLHGELAQVQFEIHEEVEKAKAATATLKRLAV
jgi:hypothetical protein